MAWQEAAINELCALLRGHGGTMLASQASNVFCEIAPQYKHIIAAAGGFKKFCLAQVDKIEWDNNHGLGNEKLILKFGKGRGKHDTVASRKTMHEDAVNELCALLRGHGGAMLASQACEDLYEIAPQHNDIVSAAGGFKRFCLTHAEKLDWDTCQGPGTEKLTLKFGKGKGKCKNGTAFAHETLEEAAVNDLCALLRGHGDMMLAPQACNALYEIAPQYNAIITAAGGFKKFCLAHVEKLSWDDGPGSGPERLGLKVGKGKGNGKSKTAAGRKALVEAAVNELCALLRGHGGTMLASQACEAFCEIAPEHNDIIAGAGGFKKFCLAQVEKLSREDGRGSGPGKLELKFNKSKGKNKTINGRKTLVEAAVNELCALLRGHGGAMVASQACKTFCEIAPEHSDIIAGAGGFKKFCLAQMENLSWDDGHGSGTEKLTLKFGKGNGKGGNDANAALDQLRKCDLFSLAPGCEEQGTSRSCKQQSFPGKAEWVPILRAQETVDAPRITCYSSDSFPDTSSKSDGKHEIEQSRIPKTRALRKPDARSRPVWCQKKSHDTGNEERLNCDAIANSTAVEQAHGTCNHVFDRISTDEDSAVRHISTKLSIEGTQQFDIAAMDSESEDDTFSLDRLPADLVAPKQSFFDISTMDSDSDEDNFYPSDLSVELTANRDLK